MRAERLARVPRGGLGMLPGWGWFKSQQKRIKLEEAASWEEACLEKSHALEIHAPSLALILWIPLCFIPSGIPPPPEWVWCPMKCGWVRDSGFLELLP